MTRRKLPLYNDYMFGLSKISDWFDGVADGWQGGAKIGFWLLAIGLFAIGLMQGMTVIGAAGLGLAGGIAGAIGGGLIGAGFNAATGPDFSTDPAQVPPEQGAEPAPEQAQQVEPPGPTPPVVKAAAGKTPGT